MYSAPAPVLSMQAVAFLDQLNLDDPLGYSFSHMQLLASQIKFLAPKNLAVWAYNTFGFSCPAEADDPNHEFVGYSFATKIIGFVIEASKMRDRQSMYVFPGVCLLPCHARYRQPKIQAAHGPIPRAPTFHSSWQRQN